MQYTRAKCVGVSPLHSIPDFLIRAGSKTPPLFPFRLAALVQRHKKMMDCTLFRILPVFGRGRTRLACDSVFILSSSGPCYPFCPRYPGEGISHPRTINSWTMDEHPNPSCVWAQSSAKDLFLPDELAEVSPKVPSGKTALWQLWTAFVKDMTALRRQAVSLDGIRHCLQSLVRHGGVLTVEGATTAAIKRYLREQATRRRWKPWTYNTHRSKLNSFFKFLWEEGLIPENPMRRIRAMCQADVKQPTLSEDQSKIILGHLLSQAPCSLVALRNVVFVLVQPRCPARTAAGALRPVITTFRRLFQGHQLCRPSVRDQQQGATQVDLLPDAPGARARHAGGGKACRSQDRGLGRIRQAGDLGGRGRRRAGHHHAQGVQAGLAGSMCLSTSARTSSPPVSRPC